MVLKLDIGQMNVKNVSQKYNGYFGDFNETIVDMIYDFACELC